jgi:hypothetical protein
LQVIVPPLEENEQKLRGGNRRVQVKLDRTFLNGSQFPRQIETKQTTDQSLHLSRDLKNEKPQQIFSRFKFRQLWVKIFSFYTFSISSWYSNGSTLITQFLFK